MKKTGTLCKSGGDTALGRWGHEPQTTYLNLFPQDVHELSRTEALFIDISRPKIQGEDYVKCLQAIHTWRYTGLS